MAKALHTISMIEGSVLAFEDRLHVGLLRVPYGAGPSNGTAVTTAYAASIPPGALLIPASTTAGSVAAAQTTTGVSVTVTPPAGVTLAAGTAAVLVLV